MNPKVIDMTGQRFGRLLVVSHSSKRAGNRDARWNCRCECGKQTVVSRSNLVGGLVASCGCARGTHRHTAGKHKTSEYAAWQGMIDRCTNPQNAAYHDYGGRGISVCERWLRSFEDFLIDMGPKPLGLTIDRWPDNNGNYEPGNCRWATWTQQANNKRTTVQIEYQGEARTLREWSDHLGISLSTLCSRYYYLGYAGHPGKLLSPVNIRYGTPIVKTPQMTQEPDVYSNFGVEGGTQ